MAVSIFIDIKFVDISLNLNFSNVDSLFLDLIDTEVQSFQVPLPKFININNSSGSVFSLPVSYDAAPSSLNSCLNVSQKVLESRIEVRMKPLNILSPRDPYNCVGQSAAKEIFWNETRNVLDERVDIGRAVHKIDLIDIVTNSNAGSVCISLCIWVQLPYSYSPPPVAPVYEAPRSSKLPDIDWGFKDYSLESIQKNHVTEDHSPLDTTVTSTESADTTITEDFADDFDIELADFLGDLGILNNKSEPSYHPRVPVPSITNLSQHEHKEHSFHKSDGLNNKKKDVSRIVDTHRTGITAETLSRHRFLKSVALKRKKMRSLERRTSHLAGLHHPVLHHIGSDSLAIRSSLDKSSLSFSKHFMPTDVLEAMNGVTHVQSRRGVLIPKIVDSATQTDDLSGLMNETKSEVNPTPMVIDKLWLNRRSVVRKICVPVSGDNVNI